METPPPPSTLRNLCFALECNIRNQLDQLVGSYLGACVARSWECFLGCLSVSTSSTGLERKTKRPEV